MPHTTPSAGAEKPRLTFLQSLLTGTVAGATEVLIDHPLWTIKTRNQRGDAFTLKPSLLYRGMFANAASMIPITAVQTGLNHSIQHTVFSGADTLSNTQKGASAFLAGMGSALISCPVECVMTRQSKVGGSFYTAGKHLINEGGTRFLFNAAMATMLREGVFTLGFLRGMPWFKETVQPYCKNDAAASLAGGISAGVMATIASQSADTLKTLQQASNPRQPLSLLGASKTLYAKKGGVGFFAGLTARGARVISAITIMGSVNEKMKEHFLSDRQEEHQMTR